MRNMIGSSGVLPWIGLWCWSAVVAGQSGAVQQGKIYVKELVGRSFNLFLI